MPGCLRQRRHVSAVMVGHAVGNARGIAALMIIPYRPPRGPADPAPPLDAAGHGLAPGFQAAAQVIGAGKTGMQLGGGSIFSAAKEVIGSFPSGSQPSILQPTLPGFL